MKVFALTLASLILSQHADGFSVISRTGNPKSAPRCVQLAAQKNHNLLNADFVKGATSFAAAVALGWGVASDASVAATLPVMLPMESSSVTVSLGEYADFSMPSYRAAVDAPVMTNLIGGDKMVANPFGDFEDSKASKPVVVDKDAEAKKAEAKKDAKAEQKAARERQKADADALAASLKANSAVE